MTDYLYIIKTVEDNKIRIATNVDTVDGVMLCEGKICAVLKRYTPPVDMAEVTADMQRFSGSTTPQPSQPNGSNMRQLAATFFGTSKKILAGRFGCGPAMKEEALSRIAKVLDTNAKAITGKEVPFSLHGTCPKEGVLSLLVKETVNASGTVVKTYLRFCRVAPQEFYTQNDECSEWGKYWKIRWVSTYYALDESKTGEVFMQDHSNLYMENPNGVDGYYKLSIVNK